ncbi:MAG: beta-glucuronidase [Clostridiales bacterium]|nr:beta-glucuronidase [Clostridiales bacterium]
MRKINKLNGKWNFKLDKDQVGIDKKYFNEQFSDSITLPTTISEAKKVPESDIRHSGYLTDPYEYSGFAWFSREISIDQDVNNYDVFLLLERTRISHIWIDDNYVGTQNSLSTSHFYDLTSYITKPNHRLTILVDNVNYPVKGGHMTSPDTQTNWIGILGQIELQYLPKTRINSVKISTDWESNSVSADVDFSGNEIDATIYIEDGDINFDKKNYTLTSESPAFTYVASRDIEPWSEHNPKLYNLVIDVSQNGKLVDRFTQQFGFRTFKAGFRNFSINGEDTYLRGKHDGLIFPLTGYAPMDVEDWLKVMQTAKDYGINHYRFHTCCPPRAAFIAADLLGIYMQPELPFWGTITDENDEDHDENAQQFLIDEGFHMIREFGNHPSFVMMTLGNELWGSKERLDKILGDYKQFNADILYSQGCNNYQFMPVILPNDDFHVGVRCSRDRLYRGSYAMCDAPQGHIQTAAPNSTHDYNEIIRPSQVSDGKSAGGTVEIQYGTGVKTVSAESSDELYPEMPVISHEIGQYSMYPDYREIDKYTGVLKARNFEIFRERLDEAGMLHRAQDFFMASGQFAAQCYKDEMEAALRTSELAGFQLLDLQDFTGQGTALVGVLNSFMESKGVITEEGWNASCSDRVLLAKLPHFIYKCGEQLSFDVALSQYAKDATVNPTLKVSLLQGEEVLHTESHNIEGEFKAGLFDIKEITLPIPNLDRAAKLTLTVELDDIKNEYQLWVYPAISSKKPQNAVMATDIDSALKAVEDGKNALYIVQDIDEFETIVGTYCTDFWNYPMFRSISESMGRPEPIGTLGLLIDDTHPALKDFPSEIFSTPQWYDIVESSSSIVLDKINIDPIVQTIDNVERNHRLGLLFEVTIGESNILICTSDLLKLADSAPAQHLLNSLVSYVDSPEFKPGTEVDVKILEKRFK